MSDSSVILPKFCNATGEQPNRLTASPGELGKVELTGQLGWPQVTTEEGKPQRCIGQVCRLSVFLFV